MIRHPLTAFSQLLTNDQLPGLKIEKESLYDGTSLYGYIDGGSTLYFEYGFDQLVVQEAGDGWKSKDNQTERWLVKKIGEKTIWVEVR